MIIYREFTFDSAHFLPNVPEGHKCRNMHGHTYKLKVYFEGSIDNEQGWVMDFAEIKQKIGNIIDLVDHKTLNEVPGLENPTCERLAVWLWEKIKAELPLLTKIKLDETPTSGVIYRG